MKSRFLLDDNSFAVEYDQDEKPYLERNKQLQGEKQNGSFMRLAASIPHIATMAWMRDDGIFWPRLRGTERHHYLARKLSDPDWKHLKTIPGKL